MRAWVPAGLVALALAGMTGTFVWGESLDATALVPGSLRELLRETLPEWFRRPIRGAVGFLCAPWLWAVAVIAMAIERVAPANRAQRAISRGVMHDFLAWGLLNRLFFGHLVGYYVIGLLVVEAIGGAVPFEVAVASEWPAVARWCLVFVLIDFLNWLGHLALHRFRCFWVFHAVHHSQREMSIFTDGRVHPLEHVLRTLIVLLPTALLGLPHHLGATYLLFQRAYTHLYHANIRTRYGPLRWVLVTPQSHRIHHSGEPRHAGKNFGGVLCIWDRLFGTHYEGREEYPATGIDDADFPIEQEHSVYKTAQNYIRQIFYPFVLLFRKPSNEGLILRGSLRLS